MRKHQKDLCVLGFLVGTFLTLFLFLFIPPRNIFIITLFILSFSTALSCLLKKILKNYPFKILFFPILLFLATTYLAGFSLLNLALIILIFLYLKSFLIK